MPTFTWSPVSGATAYRIMVATSAAALPTDPASDVCAGCVINSPEALLSYTPPVGVLRPGTTYYWKVKATGPAGPSAWSSVGSFTTRAALFAFTDTPLVAQGTWVKAVHFMELRTAVNARRAQFGLPAFAFSDATLDQTVPVRAAHVAELRTALAQVYWAVGRPVPAYSETALTARATTITTRPVSELRAAVEALD